MDSGFSLREPRNDGSKLTESTRPYFPRFDIFSMRLAITLQ
jgi:hypothetical protein